MREGAKPPVCAHPGFDLGYDLFAAEDVTLIGRLTTIVPTGIAVESLTGHGFLLCDRSSLAAKGLVISGGVIDAGYRGEINVVMTLLGGQRGAYHIKAGDKIAQMIPVFPQTTGAVEIVEQLSVTERGSGGFGSTGK